MGRYTFLVPGATGYPSSKKMELLVHASLHETQPSDRADMANVTFNSALRGLRGLLRHMKDSRDASSAIPTSSRMRSASQTQQRLREAAAYARRAAKVQPVYAELAEGTMRSAYDIALSDWFNPPVIHRILVRGRKILVEASDNVMVAKVEVAIFDEQGEIVEQGQGVRGQGDWWEYATGCSGKSIVVAAYDLAGNVTKSGV